MRGTIVLGPPPDAVAPTGSLAVRVNGSGGPVGTGTWHPADCRVRGPGRFSCTSGDRLAKLEVTTSSKTPGTPKLVLKLRGRAIAALPTPPLDVVLIGPDSAIERTGAVAACTPRGATLSCRQ